MRWAESSGPTRRARSRRRRSFRALSSLASFALLAAVLTIGHTPRVGAQAPATVRIVSLGDSYIAGNGAGSYFGPRGCYRSRDAFGQRWAGLLAIRGVDATHHNGACSGARTRDIAAQIAGSADELASATHVLLTIGGNDAGFGDLVFQCLVQRDRGDCEDAVDDAGALLPVLEQRLATVLGLVGAAAPGAVVVLVGYPLLVGAETYRLPGYEAGNAIRTLGGLAAGTFRRAVRERNLVEPGRHVYVDLHETYAGHELGGRSADWIRNVGASLIRAEWVHPTDAGHRATAALLADIEGLSGRPDAPSPGDLIGSRGAATPWVMGDDMRLRRVAAPDEVDCLLRAGAVRSERAAAVVASFAQDTRHVVRCAGLGESSARAGDLDDDGVGDLVVAAPSESVGAVEGAGAVTVLPGGVGGVDAGRSQQLTDPAGRAGGLFGAARAIGDFDGDGHADLAIGSPGAPSGAFGLRAGAVTVVPGSAAGPVTAAATVIDQAADDVDENPETGDAFGAALAAGDVDGDGFDDLVVGVPGEGLSGRSEVGAVLVVHGSADGLDVGESSVLHQQNTEVPGSHETGDRWGSSLAMGDMNGDGYADIAVGAPGEGIGSASATGAVTLLYGSPGGIRGATMLHQGSSGVPGDAESGDGWGSSLAMGDLGADGFADLVVGAPLESLGGRGTVGAVTVFVGSVRGLTADGSRMLQQGVGPVGELGEVGDRWGAALAVGDVNGDGHDDLAVGAPGESIEARRGVGAVTVVMWGPDGPDDSVVWHPDSARVPGVGEVDGAWGASVTLVDVDGDARRDLAVGAPGHDVGIVVDAGTVTVLRGSAAGVVTARSRLVHQGRVGVPDDNEAGDRWGEVGAVDLRDRVRGAG